MKISNSVKKIISIMLMVLMLLAGIATVKAYNAATVQSYLTAHNNNPWTVMALSALGTTQISADHLKTLSGTTAIQYAAPILAITSLGLNPRTFGATDYVAALENYHTDGQLGDLLTLNDDIFGVLALIASGISLDDPVVLDSRYFLLDHQNSDGGWGFSLSSTSDTNLTASAILALLAAGIPTSDTHVQNGVNYLKTAQNDDGGFPYDPKSSFGTTSDSSSTAWVIWALNALGISPDSWGKSGHNPREFLEANQTFSGYFEYQKGSGEDSFSPVTTSYAVIALAGKTLPLKILSPSPEEEFDFRIEGSEEQVCAGKVAGPTALDIVKNAGIICHFTYHIIETSFGPYLDEIGRDQASGMTGWLYLVNYHAPSVGAADYTLKIGDNVLWYYGEFNSIPARLTLSNTEVSSGNSVTATLESYTNNNWVPLADAQVYYGTGLANTNAAGQAVITLADGYYKIFATKNGFIRSNSILLKVGQPTSASISLNVRIGNVLGATTTPTISFTVEPSSLDFGTLSPGASAEKNVKITNTGMVVIHLESIADGDELFLNNLELDSVSWKRFKAKLAQDINHDYPVKLLVPATYSGEGPKSGQLTFWAMAQ